MNMLALLKNIGRPSILFFLLWASIIGTITPIGIAIKKPVAFQKSNLIIVSPLPPLDIAVPKYNIKELLSAIPYVVSPQDVFSVDPYTKYKKTILGGDGNCSNLVFGLSYALLEKEEEFEIVHFLGPGFMEGEGHTVLRHSFEHNGKLAVGLIDILNGGIPVSTDSTALDITTLHSSVNNQITQLNDRRIPQNVYYSADYLSGKRIGRIPSRAVASYFIFIENIYVPLGNEKLEKYAYDGIALLLGFLPEIHVDQKTFDYLFLDIMDKRNLYRGALISLRLSICLFLLVIGYYIFNYVRRFGRKNTLNIDNKI